MTDQLFMIEQMAGCYLAMQQPKEAQSLLKKHLPKEGNVRLGYQLALSLLAQKKYGESLQVLLSFISENPDHQAAKEVAFELMIRKAKEHVAKNDWDQLSTVLSLALQYAPDTDKARESLAPFKDAMPLFYIRSGERQKAAEIWRGQFTRAPKSYKLLHSLSLLYYFAALHAEESAINDKHNSEASKDQLDSLWNLAFGFQICLLHLDEFWKEWIAERMQAWGRALEKEELDQFKEKYFSENLKKPLSNYIDQYQANGQENSVQRLASSMDLLLLEEMTAKIWIKVRTLLPSDSKTAKKQLGINITENDRYLLELPGGCLFFRLCEVFPNMESIITALEKQNPDHEELAILSMIYQSSRAGILFLKLEERNDAETVLATLHNEKEVLEHYSLFLTALAHLKLAGDFARANQMVALDHWEAFRKLFSEKKNWRSVPGLEKVLANRWQKSIEMISTFASKKANSMSSDEGSEKAIQLLDRCIKLAPEHDLLELIASLYCDLGSEKIKDKKFEAARNIFKKALEYAPDYIRAQNGIATSYNNEAIANDDDDKAIALLEKALQFEPSSNQVKSNLAGALNSKAVQILNGLTTYSSASSVDRAINLLHRAIKLENPKLGALVENNLGTIGEYVLQELIGKLPNDSQKTMLKNLSEAYKIRNMLRR